MATVEVPVRGLHQGVSRQPDHVRFPGQLQEAINNQFLVEEAGFRKRFGSKAVGKVRAVLTDPDQRLPFHPINLSDVERYGFTIYNGTPYVMDLATGDLKTIVVDPDSEDYIDQSNHLFLAFVTILDYTLICNKEISPEMTADLTPAGANAVIFHVKDGRAGVYSIEVDGSTANYTPDTAEHQGTAYIAEQLTTSIDALLGAAYTVSRVGGSYIIITKTSAITTATCSDPAGGQGIIKTLANDFITSSDLLPAFAVDGMIVKIGASVSSNGDPVPVFHMKFTASSGNNGYWDETIEPGIAYKIDPTTMPQALIRQTDGTFTIEPIDWGDRVTGDTTSVPNPPFIGSAIFDMAFMKDRLGFATGEEWYWSTSGDYFNFWPKKSTLALDSDPFGRRAPTGRVAIQRFGVPYRRVLFSTSDEDQFETSTTELFTPKKAVIDPTTSCVASPYCRPVTMGDKLYFPTWNGPNALLLEYSYDALTLNSQAPEVTKHVRGYIPHPILGITTDPPTGHLFMWSAASPSVTDNLYVWTEFTNGDKREQSSFSTWTLAGALIHAARVVAGTLYVLVSRDDGVWIESIQLADGTPTDFPVYSPRLDRWIILETPTDGSYNAGTDATTFTTLPYAAGVGIALGTDGRKLEYTQSGGNIVFEGNVPKVIFGFEYPSSAVLSKQYFRDQNGVAILTGDLSLKRFTVAHKDTGYYQVEIAQPARDTITHKFTARVLGATEPPNFIGAQPIVYGTFMKGGFSAQGDTATITIRNDTHLPHTITAVVFEGEFTEAVRQG